MLLFPHFIPLDACTEPHKALLRQNCRAAALELWQLSESRRGERFWPVKFSEILSATKRYLPRTIKRTILNEHNSSDSGFAVLSSSSISCTSCEAWYRYDALSLFETLSQTSPINHLTISPHDLSSKLNRFLTSYRS